MDAMREQHLRWLEARRKIETATPKLRVDDGKKRTIYLSNKTDNDSLLFRPVPLPPVPMPTYQIKMEPEAKQKIYQATSRATIVMKRICELRGISVAKVKSQDRHRNIVMVRAEIVRYLRKLRYSMPKIGQAMNRDHTSVLHILRKYGEEVTSEQEAEYGFRFESFGAEGQHRGFPDASVGDPSPDATRDDGESCQLPIFSGMGTSGEQGAYGSPAE